MGKKMAEEQTLVYLRSHRHGSEVVIYRYSDAWPLKHFSDEALPITDKYEREQALFDLAYDWIEENNWQKVDY
jgi:hypothetical protein